MKIETYETRSPFRSVASLRRLPVICLSCAEQVPYDARSRTANHKVRPNPKLREWPRVNERVRVHG